MKRPDGLDDSLRESPETASPETGGGKEPGNLADLGKDIPQPVLSICRRLQEAGFPCVLVGGAVRDLLMGRVPKDWDLATQATPRQVQQLFRRVLPTGLPYGTVTVMDFGFPCEVTSFRREAGYEDGRHPSWVQVGVPLQDDLSRRDFTINAMAYDPLAHRLVDPFGGRADLQQGLIRAVGSPDQRFREDPLRILRALRMASEEGFRIEEETRAAMARQAEGLRRISGERIGAEMKRLLLGAYVEEALLTAARLGVLAVLCPEWPEARQASKTVALTARTVAAASPRLPVRLAALGHRWGEGRAGGQEQASALFGPVLARWRLPKVLCRTVLELMAHHRHPAPDDKTLRRWLGRFGAEWVEDLLSLMEALAQAQEDGARLDALGQARRRLARMLAEEEMVGPHDLALDGTDIMDILGLPPGPEVGRWKKALYEYVLEDPRRNTPETLRSWLLSQSKGG